MKVAAVLLISNPIKNSQMSLEEIGDNLQPILFGI
jgi:hypothetical protein